MPSNSTLLFSVKLSSLLTPAEFVKKNLSSRYIKRLNVPARQLPFLQTLAAPYNLLLGTSQRSNSS